MPTNNELLKVSQLRVDIDGDTIIRDLSFTLFEGETLVILGPNGAGKTVLLKALLGILPFKGEVEWKPGTKLGYVPQRVPLNKDAPITVLDFFTLKGIVKEAATAILGQVGLVESQFLDKQLGSLSSGQFQRVLIAWAVAKNPEVLLLDEAMAGVDMRGEDIIHAFLHNAEAKAKTSVILVTHDLSMIYGEATRVLCMNRNNFYFGSPEHVLDPHRLQEIYGREIQFIRHDHA